MRAVAHARWLSPQDPAVIPALESSLSPSGPGAAGAVVELLAGMSAVEATYSLVRHAVYAPWPEVRKQAAKALKQRPWHDFVPVLLSRFEPPVELSYHYSLMSLSANVSVSVFREGPFADEIRSVGMTFLPDARGAAPPEATQAVASIVGVDERVREFNEAANELNERVSSALEISTGHSSDSDTTTWHRWWYDYNEYPYPEERPVVA